MSDEYGGNVAITGASSVIIHHETLLLTFSAVYQDNTV